MITFDPSTTSTADARAIFVKLAALLGAEEPTLAAVKERFAQLIAAVSGDKQADPESVVDPTVVDSPAPSNHELAQSVVAREPAQALAASEPSQATPTNELTPEQKKMCEEYGLSENDFRSIRRWVNPSVKRVPKTQ